MSNFLGAVRARYSASSILSANELVEREGINLQRGMNFHRGQSVFLSLERADGFHDVWLPESQLYVYQGHDSTTIETGGKSLDQLLMYGNDVLTENGRFYKAAHAFKDGVRPDAPQVQVYEKLDAGVWFDKGLFNLVDAQGVREMTAEGERLVYKFFLETADRGFLDYEKYLSERMLSATLKKEIWLRDKGRCVVCGAESGLRFSGTSDNEMQLMCAKDRGEGGGLLG